MNHSKFWKAACVLVIVVSEASGAVTMDMVAVGDAGNAPDTQYGAPSYGAVSYPYQIGKYEVTAGQYTDFLNAVAADDPNYLYASNMWTQARGCKIERHGEAGGYWYTVAPDYRDRPVSDICFWDACRFVNWLHNGQPTGPQGPNTTEDGAYTLTAQGMSANTVGRNPGWKWALPTENEWYKAAYYKGGSLDAGYWLYPTRSNAIPGRDLADLSGNNANHYGTSTGGQPIDSGTYYTTVGGQFRNSSSPYGTFDQGGNVWEWNETVTGAGDRCMRGGAFLSSDMEAWYSSDWSTIGQSYLIGFRVVQTPEPGTALLLALAGGAALRRRRSSC